jgi:hypothetical protein
VEAAGSKRFEQRLQERTLARMTHRPAPLPAEQIEELDKMQKSWK